MSTASSDEYESQLYKVDPNITLVIDPHPFEVIFLNRGFKGKIDDGANVNEDDAVILLPHKLSKANIRDRVSKRELTGIAIDISGHLFEEYSEIGIKLFNEPDNVQELLKSIKLRWNEKFPGTYSTPSDTNIFSGRRLIATITSKNDVNDLFNMLTKEISTFLLDLAHGSVDNNLAILNTLEETRTFGSHATDCSVAYSILAIISPRRTMTGRLKKEKQQVQLVRCDHIVVTADRNYANRGSKKVIYVNCAHNIHKLKPNDYIHIDDITLRVVKQVRLSVDCIVVQEGILRPGRQVYLPCHLTLNQVTVEEIQDITFAHEVNINTLVLPVPGCSTYYESIRFIMKILKTINFRIFAKVKSATVCSEEYAKWIADTYDGIVLVVDENSKPHQVIRFTENVRYLIKRLYSLKKAIIMSDFMSKKCLENQIITADPDDEKHFFFHTDSYLLHPDEINDVHLAITEGINEDILARITNYAMEDLSGHFDDKSTTGSDTLARSVVRTSYEINASAIIVCTCSGRMVEKISHFRPKCPIIALTKSLAVLRYLKILSHVCVAYYRQGDTPAQLHGEKRAQFIIKKLLFGVLYGLSSRTFKVQDEAVIIYGYKNQPNVGYPNKFVAFKLNVEMVNAIYNTLK